MGICVRPRSIGELASSETSIEIVADEQALAAAEAEWNGFFARSERPSLCASHAWVGAWWQSFGERPDGVGRETRLFVVLVRREGRLVGVAPFVEECPAHWGRVRRLLALGYVGRQGVFDMTEEPSLLALPGEESRVVEALVGLLEEGLREGRWDAASLRAYLPLDALRSLRSAAIARCDARGGSDYAELPDNWGDYRKAMTRSMRDNLPYYPRLLTRDGHDWEVRLLRRPGEMADAAVRLAELHRERARSKVGHPHDAHLHGPVQLAFLSNLLRRLAAEGRATVAELVVAGEVVASQAFLEAGDTMTVSYSGYREAWYRYSPIFVLDAVVFQDALRRGVRRLDFLRNPAPWKSRWLARPGPPLRRALLVSRRPGSLLRYGLFAADQAFRRNIVRRVPVFARRLQGLRMSLGRALPPLLPVFSRFALRVAPNAHWAVGQALLHHR